MLSTHFLCLIKTGVNQNFGMSKCGGDMLLLAKRNLLAYRKAVLGAAHSLKSVPGRKGLMERCGSVWCSRVPSFKAGSLDA